LGDPPVAGALFFFLNMEPVPLDSRNTLASQKAANRCAKTSTGT